MHGTGKLRMVLTLAGLMLALMLSVRMTSAQAPGGQGRNFQGRGGGQGGFGGRMPFLSGTITGGDLNAGLIVGRAHRNLYCPAIPSMVAQVIL